MNAIINGNCIDVMKKFNNKVIDLTITAPHCDNLGNYSSPCFPFEDIAKELFRITKQGGVVVWVVSDVTIPSGSETSVSFKQALYFKEVGFNLHDTMIFKKKNPTPHIGCSRYINEFEYMFVFSKGHVKTHNLIIDECLDANLELGPIYMSYFENGPTREKPAKSLLEKKIRGNIWEYVVGRQLEDQETNGHLSPFPCALVRDHIRSWTNPGDVVFDPMCGTGTTPRVAFEMGRNYIAIDDSLNFCELTIRRIDQVAVQQHLLVLEDGVVKLAPGVSRKLYNP